MSHVICKNNHNSQEYQSRKIMSHRTEASYFLPLNEILTKVPSLMSSFFCCLAVNECTKRFWIKCTKKYFKIHRAFTFYIIKIKLGS